MTHISLLHTRVVNGTGGGPEKTILNSPRFLTPYGYDCLCAYMYPPDDPGFAILEQRAREADCPLTGIEDRGIRDWSVVRRLAQLCRERNVNIWHGHDYKSNAIGWLLRWIFPEMKLVTTVHGWVFQTARTPLYYAVDRFAIKRYDKVICVSSDLYDRCREFGVPESKLVLIENAIDTDQFAPGPARQALWNSPERETAERETAERETAERETAERETTERETAERETAATATFRIGAVGRLAPEKGFAPLIRTVADLKRSHPQLDLTIYGDGPQRTELEQLIRSLGAAPFVHLPGFASDLPKIYSEMDLFVLNSIREGLPNVCLEAMATGVPMVSTSVAGVPRLAQDERDALLVPLSDDSALKSALVRMITDPALRVRLAQTARQTIEQKFSFSRRMEKMRAVYEDLF